jgi:hypothetical protein
LPWWHVLPFLAVTLLLALPLLALLAFGQRAVRVLPKVRDWGQRTLMAGQRGGHRDLRGIVVADLL